MKLYHEENIMELVSIEVLVILCKMNCWVSI